VIETSGLALPQPLLKAFAWPDIRTRTTVDGVVTVVDAVALSEGRVAIDEAALDAQRSADPSLDHDDPIEEVFEDQLACADLIVLSKSDLVAANALSEIESKLGRALRSNVRVVRSRGGLAPQVLIGLGAAAENDLGARAGHHGEDEEHNHDDFESIVVSPAATTADDLKARVGRVLRLDGILRIKGYAQVAGKSAAAIVQAVGDRIDISFARPDAAPKPGIVVIGLRGFDQAAARTALAG
jgi:cobalamin biosynthesis protein CobW